MKTLMIAWVVATMLTMGLSVTVAQIASAARRHGLMTRSILANVILIPGVVLGLCLAMELPQEIAIGMLISSAAPGAPLSPVLCDQAKGDLPFALGLLVIFSILCVAVTPTMCGLILPAHGELKLDLVATIQIVVVAQLLPLSIGLAIGYCWASFAKVAAKFVGVLANVLLAVLLIAYAIAKYDVLGSIGSLPIAAMFIAQSLALLIGYALGGPEKSTRKVLAISTNLRNVPIALLIAADNFPGTEAVSSVIAYFVVSAIGSVAFTIYSRHRSEVLRRR
jgi:BASS family bile acid:Na+ symporter